MARPTKETVAFDRMVGQLLTVSKDEINEKMAAHRATVAANPKKRGPKPKVMTADVSVPVSPADAS